MKIEMFHLCPYRDLPEDFREKHRSVWVDPPRHLFDAEIASRTYNQTLDELKYAAEVGYDGICVNEHHQNAYGIMPSPNIMAAIMSRETTDVAIVVMGNSIALYDPPIRVAEEFAMLDCISGGRLVAGFPDRTHLVTPRLQMDAQPRFALTSAFLATNYKHEVSGRWLLTCGY